MPADPFDTLGLPARFDLDPARLQAAWLKRSAAVHPDAAPMGALADPGPDSPAAHLNLARQTLENPESRADVLLRRFGGPSREQERSLPPGFLAEIMEIREEIEAAAASHDAAEVQRWETWAEERRQKLISDIGRMFSSLGTPPDPASLKAIRIELNVWRYIERLVEQLDPR